MFVTAKYTEKLGIDKIALNIHFLFNFFCKVWAWSIVFSSYKEENDFVLFVCWFLLAH